VVVVQSDLLDGLATRLVIPLAALNFAGKAPAVLCPRISVNGQHFYALAHYAAPLPSKQLLSPVDNVLPKASARPSLRTTPAASSWLAPDGGQALARCPLTLGPLRLLHVSNRLDLQHEQRLQLVAQPSYKLKPLSNPGLFHDRVGSVA
jgi:hypothetical protein